MCYELKIMLCKKKDAQKVNTFRHKIPLKKPANVN